MNCRLNIIEKVLDQANEKVEGRPSFTFDRKNKHIIVNIGGRSRAKSFTQAEQIARELAMRINATANSDRYFDDIALAGGNNVYIRPTTKYIDGMMRFNELQDIEAYNEYMKETSEKQLLTPSVLDEFNSLEALAEQEDLFDEYVSQGLIKSLCKL